MRQLNRWLRRFGDYLRQHRLVDRVEAVQVDRVLCRVERLRPPPELQVAQRQVAVDAWVDASEGGGFAVSLACRIPVLELERDVADLRRIDAFLWSQGV